MQFHKVIAEPKSNINSYIKERIAVRGIIYKRNKILLVHSNRDYYKFPGGGVEQDESHEEALIREIREETGYVHCQVAGKAGTVIERKIDEYDNNALFQMTSHYYFCELIDENKITQELDDYEQSEQFTPVWVTLRKAIRENDILINKLEKNSFLKRENYVLNLLNQYIKQD